MKPRYLALWGVGVALLVAGILWAQQGGGIQGGIVNLANASGTLAVGNGGTGATSLTGVLHGNGSNAFTVGNVALTSEVSGVLPVANGGTNLSGSTDDNTVVGNGTTWQSKALPACLDTGGNHLNYDASGNSFSCGTSTSILSGTSASLGGSLLLAGACASNATTVTGAGTTMGATANPNTYPGDGTVWSAQVTGANTVTVRVCAIVAATPTSSTYNIRVFR